MAVLNNPPAGEYRLPVGVKAPVDGSYSTGLAVRAPGVPIALNVPEEGSKSSMLPSASPPEIRTVPFGSSAAECPSRTVVMFPVALKVPVVGS
jgi:hypothetical protein